MTKRLIAYFAGASEGWTTSLLTVEATHVVPEGKLFLNSVGIFHDDLIQGLKTLADAVHANGAKISVQLNHSGRQGMSEWTGAPLGGPLPHSLPSDESHAARVDA